MSNKHTGKKQILCENCIYVTYGEALNNYDVPIIKCSRNSKQVEQTDTCKHAKSAFNEDDSSSVRSKRIKTEKNM